MKKTIEGQTDLVYQQRREAERKSRLAMPCTIEWKPLKALPKVPYHRPTYDAPGCIIRSPSDEATLA